MSKQAGLKWLEVVDHTTILILVLTYQVNELQSKELKWLGMRLATNSIETLSRLTRNSQIKHGLPNYAKIRPMNNLTNKGGSEISRSWNRQITQ